jgi:hypothetical protein
MRWTELSNAFLFISKRKVVLLRLVGGGLLHLEVAAILERLHCNRLGGHSVFLRRVRRRVEI